MIRKENGSVIGWAVVVATILLGVLVWPSGIVRVQASGRDGDIRPVLRTPALPMAEKSTDGVETADALAGLRKDPSLSELQASPSNSPSPATAAAVANGSFENGRDGSWEEVSVQGWQLILNEEVLLAPPHGGSWAVWLGGDDDEISFIRQIVTVPTHDPVLRYWAWIASQEEDCGYDFGGIIVNDAAVVDVFDLCAATNTGQWVQRSVNLGAYAGQGISIQLRAETDASVNSNLFIDDVSLGGVRLRLYLPMSARQIGTGPVIPFAPPCSAGNNHCEPYNTWRDAYGPLEPNSIYSAYPNDKNDYYTFTLDRTTKATLRVIGYVADGQVLVRGQNLEEIAKDFNKPPDDGIMTVSLPNLPPGRYFVQIFSASALSQSVLYAMTLEQ